MMKERNPGMQIEVIDTRAAALCQGWMVIEAARDALAGIRLGEIADKVRKMIPITRMIQTADTLRYLYLGGRIGKAQALAGSLLNVKPILTVEDGVVVPVGRVRGRQKALQEYSASSVSGVLAVGVAAGAAATGATSGAVRAGRSRNGAGAGTGSLAGPAASRSCRTAGRGAC